MCRCRRSVNEPIDATLEAVHCQVSIAEMKLVKQLTSSVAKTLGSGGSGDRSRVPIQTGALPWRLGPKKSVEVLLVTGRRSRRWMIPKGWPMPGKSLAEAAAQEAFEEAGVTGTINPKPIGTYRHTKQLGAGIDIELDILVHPLWVDKEFDEYPELGQRKRKWFEAAEAARRVESPELGEIIRRSARGAALD
jgi:8-oxo-dGTP pyrophosphatase MutT (NUDIX family)